MHHSLESCLNEPWHLENHNVFYLSKHVEDLETLLLQTDNHTNCLWTEKKSQTSSLLNHATSMTCWPTWLDIQNRKLDHRPRSVNLLQISSNFGQYSIIFNTFISCSNLLNLYQVTKLELSHWVDTGSHVCTQLQVLRQHLQLKMWRQYKH